MIGELAGVRVVNGETTVPGEQCPACGRDAHDQPISDVPFGLDDDGLTARQAGAMLAYLKSWR